MRNCASSILKYVSFARNSLYSLYSKRCKHVLKVFNRNCKTLERSIIALENFYILLNTKGEKLIPDELKCNKEYRLSKIVMFSPALKGLALRILIYDAETGKLRNRLTKDFKEIQRTLEELKTEKSNLVAVQDYVYLVVLVLEESSD